MSVKFYFIKFVNRKCSTFAMSLNSGPLLIRQTLKRHITDRCKPILTTNNQLRSSDSLSSRRSNGVVNGWRRRVASQSWLMEICAFSKASSQMEKMNSFLGVTLPSHCGDAFDQIPSAWQVESSAPINR